MFFQLNRDGLTHSPHVSWGHAVSADLVHWQELEPALVPVPPEIGCWSGSTVIGPDGPVIAYTRIASSDWDRGQVALARPTSGMTHWRRDASPPVVDGPPDELDIIAFRDPQIRPTHGDDDAGVSTGWMAILGGGLVGIGGCAVQYSVSEDLVQWTPLGVLASRDVEMIKPFSTGTVWECPQFVRVDGQWVLIVSVWQEGVGLFVAYATGDYDGSTFEPTLWGRFAHDDLQYATTTFIDASGAVCAMSWVRELSDLTVDDPSPWRSAMSLPMRLSVSQGRLLVSHHPGVRSCFTDVLAECVVDSELQMDLPSDRAWLLSMRAEHAAVVTATRGSALVWRLTVDPEDGSGIVVGPDGAEIVRWEALAAHWEAELVVDADLVSLTSPQAGGCVVARLPPGTATADSLEIAADTAALRLATQAG